VELAEREAVGNDRLAQGMAVGEDVGGLQQLVMAEAADGAALLVGAEHALAKPPLVQVLPDDRRRRPYRAPSRDAKSTATTTRSLKARAPNKVPYFRRMPVASTLRSWNVRQSSASAGCFAVLTIR